MTAVRRTYVDGHYGQMHVRYVRPASPLAGPLVCLHATPFSSRSYEPLMEELGRDRAIYAVDTPGYGESDRPPQPLSVPAYAEALLEAIDALGLDGPLDLIGTHTGSRLAVEIAIARPRQVGRLVLVGCAVYSEAERREQERWSYEVEIPREDEGVEQQVLRIVRTVESFRRVGCDDAMIERRLSEILRDRQYSSWAHVGVFAHDLGARLPLLLQPVLLINADDDLHGPTQRAPALLRDGRIVDLSPAGFGVLESEPARCAELIRQFLAETPT